MINGKTNITGLLGWPVRHSLSPAMHNKAFLALNLNWAYIPLLVEPSKLEWAIKGISALGFVGVNVTVPHKVNVLNYLDDLSKEAKLIGAVNTIVNHQGKLKGYNTDGIGFYKSLEVKNWWPQDKIITILGAGGAARAIAMQGALYGVKGINIINRTFSRAQQLAKEIPGAAAYNWQDDISHVIANSHLVVNASSYGMGEQTPPPFPPQWLDTKTLVADIVYEPRETGLLQSAKKQGCSTVNGLGMLLYQGVSAWELWTGQKAPVKIMAQALEQALPN